MLVHAANPAGTGHEQPKGVEDLAFDPAARRFDGGGHVVEIGGQFGDCGAEPRPLDVGILGDRVA